MKFWDPLAGDGPPRTPSERHANTRKLNQEHPERRERHSWAYSPRHAVCGDADGPRPVSHVLVKAGRIGRGYPRGPLHGNPLELWRRARDSNPQGPRGPVDFKSTALPVEASPPCLQDRTLGFVAVGAAAPDVP